MTLIQRRPQSPASARAGNSGHVTGASGSSASGHIASPRRQIFTDYGSRITDYARTLAVVLGACALIAASVRAEEETARGRELIFVPPPVEGVISLGVYDQKGKLVRVLKKGAEIESFKAGLNGLYVTWDGNDSQGRPAQGDRFYARGVMIGGVRIDGVAFHLNDFVTDRDDPRPSRLISAALLDNGQTIIATDQSDLIVLGKDGKDQTPLSWPGSEPHLRSAGARVLVIKPPDVSCLEPADGKPIWQKQIPELVDADAVDARSIFLLPGKILIEENGTVSEFAPPAGEARRCAWAGPWLVVATADQKLWKLEGGDFVNIGSGDLGEIVDLAGGARETVWVLSKRGDKSMLQQVDVAGKRSRELELPADLQMAARIAPSRTADSLILICEGSGRQRLVGLRFHLDEGQQSVWENWLDRSIYAFDYFDIPEGKVTATTRKTESPPVMVRPENNPLENTRQANFQLTAYADSSGIWTLNSDGLPLFQVAKSKNIKQLRWISDSSNGMRVYASDGVVVEEYRLTGLAQLYRFDAGSFESE
jgi:hypothetical protein